jgi:hypothetical protein
MTLRARESHTNSRQRLGLRQPSGAFPSTDYQSALTSNSSATEIRSVLNRQTDFTIAAEAVRSNHAAEHHGY